MPASEIFSIILMGAASLLCLALIIYLNKITKSVSNIERSISGLSSRIGPILENITDMTEKINDVTEEIKRPVNEVVDIVAEIKERIDVIFNFEEKIRTTLSDNLTGIINGIKTFWDSYRGNGIHKKTIIANKRSSF